MKSQALRWISGGVGVALLAGAVAAQTGRGSGREGFGNLGQGAPAAERGSSVSGPTLGYVVDASTGNLHMVNGIAGSSTLGSPVHRGAAIKVAAVAPSADYAVVADESGAGWFYGLAGPRGVAAVELSELEGATHLATSPSGDAFVSYAAGAGKLVLYRVSAGKLELVRSNALAVNGEVIRLALPDGAKDPAVITRDAAGTSVLRVAEGGVRTAAALPGAIEVAFLRGSEKALILDASQNALYEADLAQQNPALTLIASDSQGIEAPVGLALSEDNRTAAIASAANRKATLIDLASRSATQIDLPETPTGIRRMNSRAVFQLTDASSGPMLLLDVQGTSARTVYVPLAEGGRNAASGRASLQ